MEQSAKEKVLDKLIKISETQGYVLYDDILSIAEQYELPLTAFDSLSSSLSIRGILLYDDVPNDRLSSDDEDDEIVRDMAQIDYEEVYAHAKSIDPRLADFIDEVRMIKPPQHGEIKRLIPQAKEGNVYARHRIVESQLRQAIRVSVLQYENYGYDLIDCISSACMGLIIAIDKYAPSEGAFGSYAGFWMFQYIQRFSIFPYSEVYVPSHKKEALMSCYKYLRSEVYGILPDDDIKERIKAFLKCEGTFSDSIFEDACNVLIPFLSVDEMTEEDEMQISYVIPYDDAKHISPADEASYSMLREQLMEVLGTLTDREQQVLRLRYGLDDGRERTLEEVGQQFNVTRERIRQIETKALTKLRHPNRSKRLIDYL